MFIIILQANGLSHFSFYSFLSQIKNDMIAGDANQETKRKKYDDQFFHSIPLIEIKE